MKKTVFKSIIISIITAAFAVLTLAGCGCDNKSAGNSATGDEAAVTSAAATADSASTALSTTEKAIANQGLSVNEKGEIIDAKGDKVKTTADGKVKVTTSDGKTVEVSANQVKETQQKTTASAANRQSGGNQSSQTSVSSQSSQSSQTSKPSQSSQSSQTSKPSQSSQSSQTSRPSQSSQSSQTSRPSQSSQSSQTSRPSQSSQSSKTQPTQADPHAGKTYHEAVYKIVEHPAETKQVKVVDREAYTYEEPVYETRRIAKCKDCGMDLFTLGSQEALDAHSEAHVLAGGDGGWYSTTEQVQVGTETITVPEQSHMETVVVKEAWTERILVREAGWY